MGSLSRDVFDRLSAPGPRRPWLREWLLERIWTRERYEAMPPLDFLEQGERAVNDLEAVIAAAAPRLYDELLGEVPPGRDVRAFLTQPRPCAVVVFDGLSLR